MKLLLKILALGILSLVAVGHHAVNAQGFGGFNIPNMARGTVTAIDTTGNTVTVMGRGDDATATTYKITSTTKYTKQTTTTLAAITVGNFVTVRASDDIPAGATTVEAAQIIVVPALPAAPPGGANSPFAARFLDGTVLTISPAITIKAADGTTVTITTTDDTRYSQTVPALVTDIAVGNNVMVDLLPSDNTVATAVHIVPARRRPAAPPAN
jgi:hypothetical protein